MDFFDVVNRRHSYRGSFTDRKVPREDLCKIVEAGLKAPSGMNAQTTTFVVVDHPGLIRQITSMHKGNKAMQQARAFIACVTDVKPEPIHGQLSFQVEDCSAAVENLLLAVTALGYATVWIDGWLRGENRAETIGRLLALPEGKIVRVILPIGVPVEEHSQPEKKPFEERAWFNEYGVTEE